MNGTSAMSLQRKTAVAPAQRRSCMQLSNLKPAAQCGVRSHALPGHGASRGQISHTAPLSDFSPLGLQVSKVHRSVRVGSSDGSAPQGQVTGALMDMMSSKIKEALEAKKVEVLDVYGDGRHVSIEVVSDMFEGESQMKRQRMVYKAIWLELQEAVHAVDSMATKTSSEAGM